MNILEDGLYAANDFPEDMPELRPPAKAVPHWAQPVPDALTREQYLAIGRPLLIAAGFLKADGSEVTDNKPPLPKMPDTPRKPRAKKAATPPAPKTGKDEPCPF